MKLTFRGGIHPLHKEEEGKSLSASAPITEMPAPKIVRIPLRQDISKPAIPFVEPGDRVLMGQLLGKADGFLSVPIHSSVAGTVTAIEEIPSADGKTEPAIIIENDFTDETAYAEPRNYLDLTDSEIIHAIKWGGIVGMGGAGFPTHVKLSAPPQKRVDMLIINGAECEPFLTADQRLMMERADNIVTGTRIMMRALGVKRAIVGIEDNKPDAIEAMRKAVGTSRHIRVEAVETKYPQGYEKTLIYALTGRVVPAGGLPMDAQVVVVNAASASAVADVFLLGEPSIRRVVTVTGAVKNPSNLLVRVGTSMEEVIEAAGGIDGVPLKIISGGPMMGRIVPTTQCAVTKNTSGIVVLDKHYTAIEKETPCIRCARCGAICPMNLSPMMLADAAEADDWNTASDYHAMDCMSCGSCSYICPAHRPLAQSIAFAKSKLHAKRVQEAKEKEEREKAEQEAAAPKPEPADTEVRIAHEGPEARAEFGPEKTAEEKAEEHRAEDAAIAETLETQTADADPQVVQDIGAAAREFEEEAEEGAPDKSPSEEKEEPARTAEKAQPPKELTEEQRQEIEERFALIDSDLPENRSEISAEAEQEAVEELTESDASLEEKPRDAAEAPDLSAGQADSVPAGDGKAEAEDGPEKDGMDISPSDAARPEDSTKPASSNSGKADQGKPSGGPPKKAGSGSHGSHKKKSSGQKKKSGGKNSSGSKKQGSGKSAGGEKK